MSLPRILVIDDLFGRPGLDRVNLCHSYGLKDAQSSTASFAQVAEPLAEAWFSTGQRQLPGLVENDADIALDALENGWPFADGRRWALVLLDLRFVSGRLVENEPEGRPEDELYGLEILKAIRGRFPDVPVVILSSLQREDVIEACRELGALDFIQRHGGPAGGEPKARLREKLNLYGLLEDERGIILGRSLALLKTLAQARRAATGDGNILVYGESGTGKELLARYIHDVSPCAAGPYVIFHPFGVAETLMEDELFGHEKGAFTGAGNVRAGLFEQANGGTLFVDEIGDIPVAVQNRLLRPIEARRVTRQGGGGEIPVELQVVLATNKYLDYYAQSGAFKYDLLNRIRAYTIRLPGLSQRRDDIPLLVEGLLEKLCHQHRARWPRQIDPRALDKLYSYDWRDGNVRTLRNLLERAVKDRRDSELLLPDDLVLPETGSSSSTTSQASVDSSARGDDGPGEMLRPLRADKLLRYEALPEDYRNLEGILPRLEDEIGDLFVDLLLRACRITMRHRPGGDGRTEVNLAGAISCLMGEKVTTIKAADTVKKILGVSPAVVERRQANDELLREIQARADRVRPSRSKNIKRKKA